MYNVKFVIVTVITCRDLKITPIPTLAFSKTQIDIQGNWSVRTWDGDRDPSRNVSRIWNQLILRAVGRPQLIAYGQRLCLEFRERVVAALGSRIHCENHTLTAVAGRSVCSLATMDPDGFRLIGKRSERTISSIIWQEIQKNHVRLQQWIPGRGACRQVSPM